VFLLEHVAQERTGMGCARNDADLRHATEVLVFLHGGLSSLAGCTPQSRPSVACRRAARGSGIMRTMPRRAKVIPFPGPLERARRAGTLRRPAAEPSGMVEVHRCDQAEAVVIR